MINFIIWLLFGALVGWLASIVMRTDAQQGALMNIIVGIVGAFLGGFLASALGFSANLEYRNTRCETFLSYLRGKESLFNDLFAGGPGCFVYEEMPAAGRRGGITGRGLEGLADAFLKAFGI